MSGSIDTIDMIDTARLGTNGTIMSSVGAVLDTKYTPLVAIGYFAQSRGLGLGDELQMAPQRGAELLFVCGVAGHRGRSGRCA